MTDTADSITAALNAAAYDVSQWLEVNDLEELTLGQRMAFFALDTAGIVDCDRMLDDLDARIGVPESLLMGLRWAVHDWRMLHGKDAL